MNQELTTTALESIKTILGLDKTADEKFKLIKGIVTLHKQEVQRLEWAKKRETESFIFSSRLWLDQQSAHEEDQ